MKRGLRILSIGVSAWQEKLAVKLFLSAIFHTTNLVKWVSGEYQETCIVNKASKKATIMFSGRSAGPDKGPYLFWEKELEKLNAVKYCKVIVPRVANYIDVNHTL